jgi:hypothetical protein
MATRPLDDRVTFDEGKQPLVLVKTRSRSLEAAGVGFEPTNL